MPDRVLSEVVELDLPRCTLTYGIAPCTATGGAGAECYNTFETCQDTANFTPGVHTIKFTRRGSPIPAGELARPYISDLRRAPSEIDIEQGYAWRSSTTVVLADETDSDVDEDPYIANRATPAQGTFWTRFLARNPFYVNREARIVRRMIENGVWGTARTERYLIDTVRGPDGNGQVRLTLKDPTKAIDRQKVPVPTDGKLTADLPGSLLSGQVVAATVNTVTLPDEASAVDDFYNGNEFFITNATGSGQRRVISDYTGATRVATLATDFAVVPDTTSSFEVGPLSITLDSGKGSQYADPATTGRREFVRIGEEIIEYTAKATDTLSWSDTTRRAQFGSVREDHSADDQVQWCWTRIGYAFTDTVKDLLTDSGMAAGDIDTAGFTAEEETWFGEAYYVTVCLSEPEDSDDLLEELLPQGNAVVYWDPIAQKVKLTVLLPTQNVDQAWNDTEHIIAGTFKREDLTDLRRTRILINFAVRDATDQAEEQKLYALGEMAIDADAEGVNQFNDIKPEVIFSRWFTAANVTSMRGWVRRQLIRYRRPPLRIEFDVDPKDAGVDLVDIGDVTSAYVVGESGAPAVTRCLVTRVEDKGSRIGLRMRALPFVARYGFIAPNGTADYPTDQTYCHICETGTELMPNGDEPYVII